MQEMKIYCCTDGKIFNFSMKVISFIMKHSAEMTILFSNWSCMLTKDVEQAVSVVSFILSSDGYFDGNHLPIEVLQ